MQLEDLSQQVVDDISVSLPAGYNIAELRFVPTESRVIPEEALTETERSIIAQTHLGAPPMINVDGRPTILRIVKWMCHAGAPNENGDMFVGEELRQLSHDLFRAPNFGAMDWNHAAIIPDGESPPLMGVWYKADYAFDPAANNGMGAWGVLVTGMMFAWLFPEVADALLAEQVRSGSIKGSMACIPRSVEYVDVGDRTARVLHNPVFFTHSLLSKRPADPAASGLVSEDPASDIQAMEQQLKQRQQDDTEDDDEDELFEDTFLKQERVAELEPALAASNESGGQTMTEQEFETMKSDHETLQGSFVELQGKMDAIAAELVDANAKIADADTAVAELTTARDALAATLQATEEQLAQVTEELGVTKAELETLRAQNDERSRAERLQARIDSLHEKYREAHMKRDPEVRAKIEAHWAVLTDDEWELKLEELLAGLPARVGYVARSQQEGALLVAETSGDIFTKITSHIK